MCGYDVGRLLFCHNYIFLFLTAYFDVWRILNHNSNYYSTTGHSKRPEFLFRVYAPFWNWCQIKVPGLLFRLVSTFLSELSNWHLITTLLLQRVIIPLMISLPHNLIKTSDSECCSKNALLSFDRSCHLGQQNIQQNKQGGQPYNVIMYKTKSRTRVASLAIITCLIVETIQ